jgi:hypothetical protein
VVIIIVGCQSTSWKNGDDQEAEECLNLFKNDSTNSSLKGIIILPDAKTAVDVAEPILFNLYGRKKILRERPYKVTLISKYWVVIGTFNSIIPDTKGGTFGIVLNSYNGSVVGVAHWK